jgi:hypothetical protein
MIPAIGGVEAAEQGASAVSVFSTPIRVGLIGSKVSTRRPVDYRLGKESTGA